MAKIEVGGICQYYLMGGGGCENPVPPQNAPIKRNKEGVFCPYRDSQGRISPLVAARQRNCIGYVKGPIRKMKLSVAGVNKR